MKIEVKETERIDDLEYKGLKIIQKKDGFCFGMDSVLLSDFAKKMKKQATVLDLGTGTGIISILLTAKTQAAKFYGIEIQEQVANMAKRSVCLNGLQEKVEIIHKNIKELPQIFESNSIDVIVSNPPYKKIDTGIINKEEPMQIARHEITASLEDFIQITGTLLKSLGEFYMVHRPERLTDIIQLLKKYKLEPKEMRFVHSKIEKEPKMVLIKAVKHARPFLKVASPLIIYQEDGRYTKEILKIYHKGEIE